MSALRQPALSRITPSVTSAVTFRRAIRITRMSPKMPAVVTPMASATAMQPSGMASIAARVDLAALGHEFLDLRVEVQMTRKRLVTELWKAALHAERDPRPVEQHRRI